MSIDKRIEKFPEESSGLNETYRGIATIPEAVITHIMSDFQLDRVGGNGSVYWRRLFLHTWDISYLSGVSVWNNTEYGMSFQRV